MGKRKRKPYSHMFSVIIAAWNIEGTLAAIESLEKQTFKDWELIIVNDNSPTIREHFQNKDLGEDRYFCDMGKRRHWFGAYSRNCGVMYATGRFVCFPRYVLVETIDGEKRIENIKVGDLVKTHKGRFCQVKKTSKRYYERNNPLIQISTKNSSIKCTPEHPFLVNRSKKQQWIKANELNLDDKLLYPYENKDDFLNFDCYGNNQNNSLKNSDYFGKYKVDEDLARFLGLYLAEGCGGDSAIRFTFNNNETEYINFVKDICINKFNRIPTIYTRWATSVGLNIRSFSKLFISWFGKNAKEKKIPKFVFTWNLKNRLAFIKGYIEGDGNSKGDTKTVSSVSKNLIYDFVNLCKISGLKINNVFVVKKGKFQIIYDRICNANDTYCATLSAYSWRKLNDLLMSNINNKYIEVNIDKIENKKMPRLNYDGGQYVYNLEVEKDNSYIVNSVAVHNCFLDDDNLFKPNHLENVYKAYEENPEATMIGVYTEIRGKNMDGKQDPNYKHILKTRVAPQQCDLGSFAYQREMFRKYGYFEGRPERRITYDFELIQNIYQGEGEDKFVILEEPTFIYYHSQR